MDKNNIQFHIGEKWYLVGNYGWLGLYGMVEIIGVTDFYHAIFFEDNFLRNWFGEGTSEYKELLEENPVMYIGKYVEDESSGEFVKGQRIVFGDMFLDLEKTKQVEPVEQERKVTWCDDCEKQLDRLKNEDIFLDRHYYSVDYSKVVCRTCFVAGNYTRLERGWHEHN